MPDQTDLQIIKLLEKNSRLQWKEIGEIVHMTGQAVSARVQRLQDLGLIEGFTLKLNHERFGRSITGLITVFMKTTDHSSFHQFLRNSEIVFEAHRSSGDGCYWIKINASSQEEVKAFLDQLLKYANYRISLSIDKIK